GVVHDHLEDGLTRDRRRIREHIVDVAIGADHRRLRGPGRVRTAVAHEADEVLPLRQALELYRAGGVAGLEAVEAGHVGEVRVARTRRVDDHGRLDPARATEALEGGG